MKNRMMMVLGAWCVGRRLLLAQSVLCAGVAQAESVEHYYDKSDHLVQSFPNGRVRTVDYAPTAEEIAAADAAIDAADGSGPKLAPPLAVQNADSTLTIIRGGVEANRLIRRLGDLSPETDIPMRRFTIGSRTWSGTTMSSAGCRRS